MDININGQKSSKKNSALVIWIFFAIIFFDVIVKLLSQGAFSFFIVLFIFFLFYTKFARPLKRQKWSINSDFAFQNRADEDIPPRPSRQESAVSTIRTKRSDLEEISWNPAENYTKEEEDENSESYWRNRESKKISSGKMLMDMGSLKREEGGRFK